MSQAEDGIFFGPRRHGLADQLHGGISHIHGVSCPGSRPASLPLIFCEVCTDSRPLSVVEAVTWALSQVCVCVCAREREREREREEREREKEGDKRNDRGTSPVHSMRREGEREMAPEEGPRA